MLRPEFRFTSELLLPILILGRDRRFVEIESISHARVTITLTDISTLILVNSGSTGQKKHLTQKVQALGLPCHMG